LRAAEVPTTLLSSARFEALLAQRATGPVPLLVVRLPALERVAWRHGLRAAQRLERRATAAFTTAVARVVRERDLVAHDAVSDVYVAALLAPTREGPAAGVLPDARAALARIVATITATTRLEILTGWTLYDPVTDADNLHSAVARGLRRGAQERERYAFFSALGHELRTPLSSIRGYLETLLDESVDAQTRQRFTRIAHAESLRLARLVEGMFEISLLDMRDAGSTPAVGSLVQALEAAHDACAAAAASRRVGIAIADVPAIRIGIETDRLTLVLVNLIENAVKHGRSGGVVFVGVELIDRRSVRVTVDDDGPGIATADRERIFAIGERAETVASGSGIGLALVRLMLERAGGRVDLEDSLLGGARFVVLVPRI
jgi:signal transduction histidine kinase